MYRPATRSSHRVGRRRSAVAFAVAFTGAAIGWPGPAAACTQPPSPNIEELQRGEPFPGSLDPSDIVLGVVEYEHLARSSGLFGDSSVIAVTRTWGTDPLGGTRMQKIEQTCGGLPLEERGAVRFGVVTAAPSQFGGRTTSALIVRDGVLTPGQAALLEAEFGPATVHEIGWADDVAAFTRTWTVELAAGLVAASSIGWFARRRRQRRDRYSEHEPRAARYVRSQALERN